MSRTLHKNVHTTCTLSNCPELHSPLREKPIREGILFDSLEYSTNEAILIVNKPQKLVVSYFAVGEALAIHQIQKVPANTQLGRGGAQSESATLEAVRFASR